MVDIIKITLEEMDRENHQEILSGKEYPANLLWTDHRIINSLSCDTLEKHVIPFLRSLEFINNAIEGAEDCDSDGIKESLMSIQDEHHGVALYLLRFSAYRASNFIQNIIFPWRDNNIGKVTKLAFLYLMANTAHKMAEGASRRIEIFGNSSVFNNLRSEVVSLKDSEVGLGMEYKSLYEELSSSIQSYIQMKYDLYNKIHHQPEFLSHCSSLSLGHFMMTIEEATIDR